MEGDSLSENFYPCQLLADKDERLVFWIFGREDELLTLGVIVYALERGLVADRDGGDLAVVYLALAANENDVTVKDARADHGVARRAQTKIGVQTVVGRRVVPQEHTAICEYLKTRCPFNQMTVMFRRDDVEEAGGYLDWYCDEDYYLWVRMFLKNKRFANLPDILVRVRVGADMYKRRGGWKYFKSEAKLQRFMRKQRVIGFPTYAVNVTKRFLLQVMMPNAVRGWVFRKFARTNGENEL